MRNIFRLGRRRAEQDSDAPAAVAALDPVRDCVILGSGRSLLDLTETERDYLNAHPRVLGMNKYLLFWQKLNVLPSAMFLADFKPSSAVLLQDTIRILRTLDVARPYYVNADYIRFFVERTDKVFLERTRRWWLRDYGYAPDLGLTLEYPLLHPFKVRTEQKTFQFASNFDEVLYHRRGSLTTAINLAAIIWPGTTIKLLGVDLSDPRYFFGEELEAQRPDLLEASYWQTKGQRRHATALPIAEAEGTVQEALVPMVAHLARRGMRLVCCNPDSLLVREGVCPHAPLVAEALVEADQPPVEVRTARDDQSRREI